MNKYLPEILTNYTANDFLTSWDDEQEDRVKGKLLSMFYHSVVWDTDKAQRKFIKNWQDIAEFFGMAYTSSSSYAMYCITNVEYNEFSPGFNWQFIGITKQGRIIAICWDKDENEKQYVIGYTQV